MIEPHFVFFCRPQANGANRVVMGAFGKSQHMQATIDHPQGDKADLSVIEAIVLALECRVPNQILA
jgi:hypothetical protein